MDVSIKKKIYKYCIVIYSAILIFTAGICVGERTRFRRIESNSDRIEQRIDDIGKSADSTKSDIEAGISNLKDGINFGNAAIGNIGTATVLNIQLQSKFYELTRATKVYQESLQLANSTINDLFDLSIRRAELDEEYIGRVIELLGLGEQSSSE